ncbi:uracil-DNA glycosylase [Candidatus Schneideria nysicola]|uniref:uracil-DNA glycosylase n=1 Tax=Candidatus Schneideria nysicola TaxID=1081631 RepID=UPI001CAA4974|nr:uracil-DNA glycosylase [Candidatus Schneideria nysicola]UAJ65157.1 uracil-DNA glycosylase [Candidatus Schneideria nysicola]
MKEKLSWKDFFEEEKKLNYFKNILYNIIRARSLGIKIYPRQQDIFNAFHYTELHEVKVVIIGQDPYHGPHQADGLAFSVRHGVPIPPSLRNIYKELSQDVPNFIRPNHGCLYSWSKQGVMLLNSILTVESGKAGSHANLGWLTFTDKVINIINYYLEDIIFLLWGSYAQKKGRIINRKKHIVLNAAHPSPLSNRSFLGSHHFSTVNKILLTRKKSIIDWSIY